MRRFKSNVVGWLSLFVGAISIFSHNARANTNSWSKTTDGFWHESFWSLGVLPDSSQSIVITNSGAKTVEINATTAQNFPASLQVNDLQVSASNTLVLNHVPTNSPFQIVTNVNRTALWVRPGAVIRNIESAIFVQQGFITLNGTIYQDGGSFRSPNWSMFIYGGAAYYLNDGIFEGIPNLIYDCWFNQSGGQASVPLLYLHGGTYHLAAGQLMVHGDLFMTASEAPATFTHDNGTNQTVSLSVTPSGGDSANYSLNGGLLRAGDMTIRARGTFNQNGGLCIVTNSLLVQGAARYYPPVSIPAHCAVTTNGTLMARDILLDNSYGFSFFNSSGTVSASEDIRFLGSSDMVSSFAVTGGQLTCSNLLGEGAVIDISQTGGNIFVTNSFVFSGYYPGVYGKGARPAQYTFNAGTLSASNITLAARMVIGGSTQTGRITNNGVFQMAGFLEVADANEPFLGKFQLLSNAVINLGSGSAKLTFAQSQDQAWSEGIILTLTNWNGSFVGGGSDQVRFGPNPSGLSQTQLNQIRFVNPAGLPAGTYNARILNTGEIVPRVLSIVRDAHALILAWDGNFSLETSTNVGGPYVAVPSATSPYTNNFGDGQRYFRIHP